MLKTSANCIYCSRLVCIFSRLEESSVTRVASLSRKRGCSCSFTIRVAIFLLLILEFVFSTGGFYREIRDPCGHPGVCARVAAFLFRLNLLLPSVAFRDESTSVPLCLCMLRTNRLLDDHMFRYHAFLSVGRVYSPIRLRHGR